MTHATAVLRTFDRLQRWTSAHGPSRRQARSPSQSLHRESLRQGQRRQGGRRRSSHHRHDKRGRDLRPVAAILQEFQAEEFELIEQVGQLGFERRSQLPQLNTSGFQSADTKSTEYVNIFTGVEIGTNYPVIMREYPPELKKLAIREIQAYNYILHSSGFESGFSINPSPEVLLTEPPLLPLLGSFSAIPLEEDQEPTGEETEEGESIWLVHRGQQLMSLTSFPRLAAYQMQQPPPLLGFAGPSNLELVQRFLVRSMVCSMRAVAFCHLHSLCHRSLSASSLLLTTSKLTQWDSIDVRIANFGFARTGDSFDPKEMSIDREALAVALGELIFGSLSLNGPSSKTNQTSMTRLLSGVFKGDMEGFREYCRAEAEWAAAVDFLDISNYSGWDLLFSLLKGSEDCGTLLMSHPFFRAFL